MAGEIFFTGTAAEIAPVRSVDRVRIEDGRVGPLTQGLQREWAALVLGRRPDPYGWRSPVSRSRPVATP